MTAVAVAPFRAVSHRLVVAAVVLVVLAAAPLVLTTPATTTVTRVIVFALLAVGLDLLVGVTGLPSLAHAGYLGAGAYAAAWVSVDVTSEVPVPLLVGGAAGALAAALTGWVAARTGGVLFLMLTLVIGETLRQVAEAWAPVTGVPPVRAAGTPLADAASVHWYVLVIGALGFGLVALIAGSPFGAALRGIRDDEPRMRASGYPTSLYKYAVFVVAGGVAGLAGSLLVAQQRFVTPGDVGLTTAALALLAVIVGGAGSLWGACLGAALVVVVRDAVGPGHGVLVLGGVLVLAVYLLPRGVAGLRRRR
jgi:branched-chain amino acid transport system permease protein